ncbi:MAG: hypothetical protein GVY36_19905 [Verrucomicrobia bacterium]|jgi:hypothetical protein|nr:hypothetical protein [Verrucomicrobiota bacterium]
MRNQNILVFIFCLFVLEVVAILNSYVVNLKGASVDAERFIEHAIQWMQFGEWQFATNSEFFIQFLGAIFLVFGPSEFIATQFGLLALLVSGLYFERLINILGYSLPFWAVLGFFLWPSLLTRVTTTMREPYMILFLVLITYFAAKYKVTKRPVEIVKLFAVSVLALFFHKAYAILTLGAITYTAFFVMEQRVHFLRSKIFYLRIAIVLTGVLGFSSLFVLGADARGLQPLIATLSGDTEFMTRVLDWKSSREFRTTYDAVLDFSTPLSLILSAPKVMLYYLFAPFPWQVANALDLLASIEGLFRLGGIWIIVRYGFVRKSLPRASQPVFVIATLLIIIWAAGTSNYGTASRHHITTNWVFLMAYVLRFGSPKRVRRHQIGHPTGTVA